MDLADDDSAFALDVNANGEEAQGWADDPEPQSGDAKLDGDEHEKWRLAEYESEHKHKCKRRRVRDVERRWSAHAVRPGQCVRMKSATTTARQAAPSETWQAHLWTLSDRVPDDRVLLATDQALSGACLVDAVRFANQCGHAPCLLRRWMLVTPAEVADPQYTKLWLREMDAPAAKTAAGTSAIMIEHLLHAAVASGHVNTLQQLQQHFARVHGHSAREFTRRPDLALTACEFGRAQLVLDLLLRVSVDINKRPIDDVIVQLLERAAFSGHADVLQTLFTRWPGIVGDTKTSFAENKNVRLSSVAQRALDLSIECNWPLVASAVGRACWRLALGEPADDSNPLRLQVLRSLVEPVLLSAVARERWPVAQALVPFCPGFDAGCITRAERRHASLGELAMVPEESGRRLVAPLLLSFLMGTHRRNASTGCAVWSLRNSVLFDRNVLSLVFAFV